MSASSSSLSSSDDEEDEESSSLIQHNMDSIVSSAIKNNLILKTPLSQSVTAITIPFEHMP